MPRKKKPAARRPKHAGTVIMRADGRIVVRFWKEDEFGNWTQHTTYLSAGATRADGEALLAQLNAARTMGVLKVYDRESVGQYLERWLRDTITPRAKPKTIDTYRFVVGHVTRRIGDIELRLLEVRHVKALKTALVAQMTTQSAALILRVFRSALAEAEREDLIKTNVAKKVPVPTSETREETPLSPAQARAVLDVLDHHPFRLFFELAILRGMREGEILALTWKAVDLDAMTLTVQATLYRGAGGVFRLVTPKTARSRRVIPLSPALVGSFRQRKAQQAADKLQGGGTWRNELGLVLTRPNGLPVHDIAIRLLYKQACTTAGVPTGRVHALRHTANTLLAQEGVDEATRMAILGHANVTINKRYIHTDEERVNAALERLERKVREG